MLTLTAIPIGPPAQAIEAGILTEFMVGLLIVGLLSIVTFLLRSFRGR